MKDTVWSLEWLKKASVASLLHSVRGIMFATEIAIASILMPNAFISGAASNGKTLSAQVWSGIISPKDILHNTQSILIFLVELEKMKEIYDTNRTAYEAKQEIIQAKREALKKQSGLSASLNDSFLNAQEWVQALKYSMTQKRDEWRIAKTLGVEELWNVKEKTSILTRMGINFLDHPMTTLSAATLSAFAFYLLRSLIRLFRLRDELTLTNKARRWFWRRLSHFFSPAWTDARLNDMIEWWSMPTDEALAIMLQGKTPEEIFTFVKSCLVEIQKMERWKWNTKDHG